MQILVDVDIDPSWPVEVKDSAYAMAEALKRGEFPYYTAPTAQLRFLLQGGLFIVNTRNFRIISDTDITARLMRIERLLHEMNEK